MNTYKDWLVYEDAELLIESPHQFSSDPTQANIDFWVRYKDKRYAGSACTLANIEYMMPKYSKEKGFKQMAYYALHSHTIVLVELSHVCLITAVKQMITSGDLYWKLLSIKPLTEAEHYLKVLLSCYAGLLSAEAVAHVQHYIDVAEYEIACESFVMSLKLEKVALSGQHADQLTDLGIALGLDKDSMFTGDFWEQHEPWLHAFSLLNRQQASHSAAYFDPALKPVARPQHNDNGTDDAG